MHDFIPIFPRDNAEENGDGLPRCREVGVPAARRDGVKSGALHSFTSRTACRRENTEAIDSSLPVDVLSVFDRSKENNAGKGITEEEEEHAHDDEEALVHADHHGQQQHLQSHLQPSQRDGRTDSVCFLFGQMN